MRPWWQSVSKVGGLMHVVDLREALDDVVLVLDLAALVAGLLLHTVCY
jgi:hypothetical protein